MMKNFKNTLRNTLYLVLALVLYAGCYPTEVHETINRTKHIEIETEIIVNHVNGNRNFKIITIDKCEYIFYDTQHLGSGTITHKGNCKYCANRALVN